MCKPKAPKIKSVSPPPAPTRGAEEVEAAENPSKKLKSKKKGRGSLRIPLDKTSTGGGASGLNIPNG